MRPRSELAQVAALGLIQGATELLPVSSSAHVAAVPALLGWDVAAWPAARRKELEVALHAGALAALAPSLWRVRPDLRTLALSLAPPVLAGYALERPIEEGLGGPMGLASGLLLGAAGLAAADRAAARPRRGTPPRVALALGVAQAAALWPGVSRTGATLAAARALGHDRADASRLSFGVAGPVLAGATGLKAYRARHAADRRALAAGALTAFAATAAARRLIGLERRGPWWPYAAERAALATAILAVRYRRAR
ncbi:MAG TPA: undecaprenyl-diphosphate phosphatase [Solirubrobacter sp.]|nr:undecaprenyl-diphosphate phosphatase [Solirubrobacter sp.]